MSVTKSYKAIAVDAENYRRLAELGRVPDSFNDIITRLLDEKEGAAKIQNVKSKAVEAATIGIT